MLCLTVVVWLYLCGRRSSVAERIPIIKRIGARMKRARERMGMTQTEFSSAMGMAHRSWAWKAETGRVTLSSDDLVAISEVLSCSPKYLLEGRTDTYEFHDDVIRDFLRRSDWNDYTELEQNVVLSSFRLAKAMYLLRTEGSES